MTPWAALLENYVGFDADMGNSDIVTTASSAATSPKAASSPASASDDDDEVVDDESMDQGEQGTVLHATYMYYRNTAHNVRGTETYRLHTRTNGQSSAPFTVALPSVLAFGSLRAGWPTTTNVTIDGFRAVITFPPTVRTPLAKPARPYANQLEKIRFVCYLLTHASTCVVTTGMCQIEKCDDIMRYFRHSTAAGASVCSASNCALSWDSMLKTARWRR
ncbi:hypothetical protein SPRG_15791 [Saprolegnia parasitica CBS 223.65]|uniref:Uncharacterized protein n=1 Tax=Saprolegnia parasitica (strain CBS 223.65) TaxID=695850 RepID=A0A067BL49_SAPPC|nr:hypothetical protein SPRG_15791 [Saprolegnia parasitica CBS 223.65]KDO18933.1 hypothetical protein SPRG_15791 [Saprolegnia parasitica CBS 223.65]|eukprot:XP_012210346.1 hypothetical protein SPRG_15791 [Saprolegnia parasitica CBS 223.65]